MPDTRTRASGTSGVAARSHLGPALRLTGLVLALALATSRLGLVAHELLGHGGAAVAAGGEVTEVELFWFAGGWIRYHFATPPSVAAQLVISMAGIAIEILAGLALWLAMRPLRDPRGATGAPGERLGRDLVRGAGTALIMHASWYLATGAWHGFGDGQLLHRVLGDARAPVAFAAGAITCACGFVGARDLVGPLRATQGSIVGLVVAVGLAGGVHAGLAIGELHVRSDTTYATIMQPEQARQVDRDLARWAAYEAARGSEVTRARREREAARLEEVHRTFPFAWLLGACTLVAVLAGARRSLAHPRRAMVLPAGLLVRAAAVATIAIAAVIAIDGCTR
jgi:hypothetical protein